MSFIIKIVIILLLSLIQFQLRAQSNEIFIEEFFRDLINNSTELHNYLSKEELEKSNRLGIAYENVKDKFLISFDIEPKVKEQIKLGNLKYEIKTETLEEDFWRAVFIVNEINLRKEFYFRKNKLISPSSYFTNNWLQQSSKYFRLIYSNPSLINEYTVIQLDSFIDKMIEELKIPNEESKVLRDKKIHYILCKDADEIEKLSGFNTRGIYILAYDEIITTYNFHVHEISHLLINYKLKQLPLYTLPILQEGFATAFGGRGGLAPNVLIDMGRFLVKSNFLQANSIFTKKNFMLEDASLTYPVSALFSSFLINDIGIEEYLKVYKKFSGDDNFVATVDPDFMFKDFAKRFDDFLTNDKNKTDISLNHDDSGKNIINGEFGSIKETGEEYFIETKINLLLSNSSIPADYQSKKWNDLFENAKYSGEKYLITVNSKEVNVYNLFTNNLIASYSSGFSQTGKTIPYENGFYKFSINKNIFDEDLASLQISTINSK